VSLAVPTDNVPVAIEGARDPAESLDTVEQPGDFVWDEEEPRPLRQEAELTASADSVRAYLRQIGKIALLNAAQEVDLAKRIEAGFYAAERVRRAEDSTDKLSPQLRGNCARSSGTASAPKTVCWRPTFAWSSRWLSGTPAVACHCWT
jgi:Sigma-70 factor, region 1.2